MKTLLTAAAILAGLSLAAAEIDVKGSFTEVKENGIPAGWQANKWKSYQPAPKMEITDVNGSKALHFTDITGKAGFGWDSTIKFPAKASENITVKFKAKGSGQAWIALQVFTENGSWIGNLAQKAVPLTAEWKDYEVVLPVKDMKNRVTAKAIVTFGAKNKAELFIGNIKVITPEP